MTEKSFMYDEFEFIVSCNQRLFIESMVTSTHYEVWSGPMFLSFPCNVLERISLMCCKKR